MSKRPFFSVIIPVFNGERYLARCLNSLFANQFHSLEVIVIDDCSTDSTDSILDDYEARYGNLVRLQQIQNSGVACARNRGLERATGEYIVFIDADDYVASNMLSKLEATAKLNPIDLLVYSYAKVDEKGDVVEGIREVNEGTYDLSIESELREAFQSVIGSLIVCNGMFRRAVIEDLRFDLLRNGEDVLFGAKAFCCVRFVSVVDFAPYYYVQRPGSASKVMSSDQVLSTITSICGIATVVMNSTHYLCVKDLLYRKIRGMAFFYCGSLLQSIPVSERGATWGVWFESFEVYFCRLAGCSFTMKKFYEILFLFRSQGLVRLVIFMYGLKLRI